MKDRMKGLFCYADWDPQPEITLTEYEKQTGKTKRGNFIWRNSKLVLRDDIQVRTPGPDDVLIKVKGCGICGSDLAFTSLDQDGYIEFPGHCRMNIVLGHEFCGEVVETGNQVANVRVGDYVASETMGWCGVCDPCRAGFHNQCMNLNEVGITQDGGMAEYVTVPAKWVYSINSIVEKYGATDSAWIKGAMVEPMCIAYNSIVDKAGGIRLGATSIVFGAGAIGLMSIACLKAMGSSRIICMETKPWRMNAAKDMGAHVVYNPIELEKQGLTVHDIVMQETHGLGIDVVVEAAGMAHITLPGIVNCLGVQCKIMEIGMSSRNASFNYTPLQQRGCEMSFTLGSSAHNSYNDCIRLQASGLIDVLPAVGNTYTIDQYEQAFKDAREANTGKIIFLYP